MTVEHRFGRYGGQYVPETLMPALQELEAAWIATSADPAYHQQLDQLLKDYCGRPTPLYHAQRLSEHVGRTVLLKREDLNHTGSHKMNNALGQALLAQRMGKQRIIAETGAGSHGVATATACALLGLECVVFMGTEDMRRQRPNVLRMELLGARVQPVEAGARTLKEADLRGDPRLGHQRRRHLLRDRLGGRARALPEHGPRPAAAHRRRGPRRRPGDPRAPAGPRDRLRGRRVQRDGRVHCLPRRPGGRAGRGRGRRGRPGHDAPRRSADRRRAGRSGRRPARRDVRADADRGRPDQRGALDLRGSGLPRHRAPARAPAATPGASASTRSPTPRRWRPSRRWHGWRGSSPRWSPATPSRGCSTSPRAIWT